MAHRVASKTRSNIKESVKFKDYQPLPSKRQTITPELCAEAASARINAIFGNTGSGKSSWIASQGFLNLDFKAMLNKRGFSGTVKVLQKGVLPEICKIGIIDPDMKWLIDMEQGDWKAKYRPLVERGTFELDEFQVMRTEETKQGEEIKVQDPGIEREKEEFESAIINNLRDSSIDIVAIDSMSDYIRILDDRLDLIYWENPNAFSGKTMEGLKSLKQVLYGKRAKWFFNMLSEIRRSRKMTILSFEQGTIPSNKVKHRKPGVNFDPMFEDPEYYIKWVPLTGYKVDNVIRCMKDYMRDKYRIQWKKGPWRPEENTIDLPGDPLNALHFLESCAPILLGEYDRDAFEKGDDWW